MSKLLKLSIKNFIGISEKEVAVGKVNLLSGPEGSGKSSFIEAIEKCFTNKDRRKEVVKHGEEEATLYAEVDNGLEVNRKIRTEKADYLKIRKNDEGVPNTEKYLQNLINGNIFRPLDWMKLDIKEQSKSILNMLEIGWTMEDIQNWFSEIPSNIEFDQHILMILTAIENKYFKDRTETNKQIKELETQIEVIKKELPPDYDGEDWREKNLQEYYKKVLDAQTINHYIDTAKALKENYDNKIKTIEAEAENGKSRVAMEYKDKRQDIKDIIDLSNSKIEKASAIIENVGQEQHSTKVNLENEEEKEIQKIKDRYRQLVIDKVKEIQLKADEQKDLINIQNNKIAAKEQELLSLDELETQAIEKVETKKASEIEIENTRIGKASQYLEDNKLVDVEPLQKEADEIATMQSYIRQWDNLVDIRDNKLSEKKREAQLLTARVETARNMPLELMKTAKMPIIGITVDSKGLIRINGTLIDGLSDGEKFKLALTIAKAQCGELKLICLDGWQLLSQTTQDSLLQEMKADEYQYFLLKTVDTDTSELEIEVL